MTMTNTLLKLNTGICGAVRGLLSREERGASLVEYALLVALIALVCFVAVGFLGEETSSGIAGAGSSFSTP